MSEGRKRVKRNVNSIVDHLEWCVTHSKSIQEAFQAYTDELLAMANDPDVKVDEDVLTRYLGYSLNFKELEEGFVMLLDIIKRIDSEL